MTVRVLVKRFREEAERLGFWWACAFMTGYITAMFRRDDTEGS